MITFNDLTDEHKKLVLDEDTAIGYVNLFEQINRNARVTELARSTIELLE